MTGAYLRVKRNGRWENIEVEFLTDEERSKLFLDRHQDELVRWLNMVCNKLAATLPAVEEYSKGWLPE